MLTLTDLPRNLTKERINEYRQMLSKPVADGDEGALSTYVKLTVFKKAIEDALKDIKEDAIEDAEKCKLPQDRRIHGVDFQLRDGALKLDYSGDQIWKDLNCQIKILEKRRKEREKELKHTYLNPDEHGDLGNASFKDKNSMSIVLYFKER